MGTEGFEVFVNPIKKASIFSSKRTFERLWHDLGLLLGASCAVPRGHLAHVVFAFAEIPGPGSPTTTRARRKSASLAYVITLDVCLIDGLVRSGAALAASYRGQRSFRQARELLRKRRTDRKF